MNTIQEQWEQFSALVLPPDLSAIQAQEMRRAFYAGVQAMINIQWEIGDESISEAAGVQMLEGIHDECRRFALEIANGKA